VTELHAPTIAHADPEVKDENAQPAITPADGSGGGEALRGHADRVAAVASSGRMSAGGLSSTAPATKATAVMSMPVKIASAVTTRPWNPPLAGTIDVTRGTGRRRLRGR
jgi:hypothetical protein